MKVKLVVIDPDKAHAARVKSYRLHPRHQREVERQPKPKVGDLWTEADTDCPEGQPNCRHCGDPAFADQCAAAGHCPDCGTKHGVAPESVVANNGLEMQVL